MRVSVVTVVKNHSSGLRTTQLSLQEQTFKDWQMIIVVGDSNDDTLSTAEHMSACDLRIQVIAQHGSGIYNAMNVGLGAATGNYVWFMNAGDIFFTESVLFEAVKELTDSDLDVLIGGYQIRDDGNRRYLSNSDRKVTTLNFAFNRRGGCHQAMIFRTEVLKEIGGFDTSYSLASDFDLVLKVLKNSKGKRIPQIYAAIEPGGRADQGILLVHKEKHDIRIRQMGGPFILLISMCWTALARLKISLRKLKALLFFKFK